MTKRANGSGSVEVRADGKARVRLVVDGKRVQLGKWHDTEDAAWAALDAHHAHTEAGLTRPNAITFASWGEGWMTRREVNRRVRGIAKELDRWRAHVLDAPFYSEPLVEITRGMISDWIDQLLATKAVQTIRGPGGTTIRREAARTLSRETVVQCVRLVRSALAFAVEREVLERNVAADIVVPRVHRDEDLEDAWTFLEPHELDLILAPAGETDVRRLLVTIAIFAGPRRGELFAIDWADVHERDDLRPRVKLRRGHNGATKSGKAREVPLLTPARAAFARLRELAGGEPVGLVFPNPDGTMYGEGYDAGWRDKRERRGPKDANGVRELVVTPGLKTRHGIDRDVRFHDLRHTCASHLVMGTWGRSWTLEEVCKMLGHSSIVVTQRYAHLAPGALHAAARATHALPRVAPGRSGSIAESAVNRDGRTVDRTPDQRRVKAPSGSTIPGTSDLSGATLGQSGAEVYACTLRGEETGEAGEVVLAHFDELVSLAKASGPHALGALLKLAGYAVAASGEAHALPTLTLTARP